MKRRLTKIGNSWGLILPKDIMELLELEPPEVEAQVVGSTLVISSPNLPSEEIEASLAYLTSKRERSQVYRRLA